MPPKRKKQATAKPATVQPIALPRQTRTVYESGEKPAVGRVLGCRVCGSTESRVLRTVTKANVGLVWRRRRCADCGVVWMSKAPVG